MILEVELVSVLKEGLAFTSTGAGTDVRETQPTQPVQAVRVTAVESIHGAPSSHLVVCDDSLRMLVFEHRADWMLVKTLHLSHVCSAMRQSPSGVFLAMGDIQGRVEVRAWETLLSCKGGALPLPAAEHSRHAGHTITALCWATDSSKVAYLFIHSFAKDRVFNLAYRVPEFTL